MHNWIFFFSFSVHYSPIDTLSGYTGSDCALSDTITRSCVCVCGMDCERGIDLPVKKMLWMRLITLNLRARKTKMTTHGIHNKWSQLTCCIVQGTVPLQCE